MLDECIIGNSAHGKGYLQLIEFSSAMSKREVGAIPDPILYYQHSRELQFQASNIVLVEICCHLLVYR